MSEIKVTLTGNACADPEAKIGKSGAQFATLRVAVNEGWMGDSGWVDGETTFMSVSAFGQLARGVLASVHRGDPLIVQGRLRVASWTTNTGETRSKAEVRATSVGHDLTRGCSAFVRAPRESAPTGTASVQTSSYGEMQGPAEGRTSVPPSFGGPAERAGAGTAAETDAWSRELSGPEVSDGTIAGEGELLVDPATGEVLDAPSEDAQERELESADVG